MALVSQLVRRQFAEDPIASANFTLPATFKVKQLQTRQSFTVTIENPTFTDTGEWDPQATCAKVIDHAKKYYAFLPVTVKATNIFFRTHHSEIRYEDNCITGLNAHEQRQLIGDIFANRTIFVTTIEPSVFKITFSSGHPKDQTRTITKCVN